MSHYIPQELKVEMRKADAFERIAAALEKGASPRTLANTLADALNKLPNAPSRPVTPADKSQAGIDGDEDCAFVEERLDRCVDDADGIPFPRPADHVAIVKEHGKFFLEVNDKRLFYFRKGMPSLLKQYIEDYHNDVTLIPFTDEHRQVLQKTMCSILSVPAIECLRKILDSDGIYTTPSKEEKTDE